MKKKQWIQAPHKTDFAAVSFRQSFSPKGEVASAVLYVSAVGVYNAFLNGKKLGKAVLAPGWTSYRYRIQYQTLDVTAEITENNLLDVTVAPGWAVGKIGFRGDKSLYSDNVCAMAELWVTYRDGSEERIATDTDWDVYTTEVTFADHYDGETIDKTVTPEFLGKAKKGEHEFNVVPQVGPDILEMERLAPVSLINTPKGERVIDFGQNMTGYVSLRIKGKRGQRVVLSHGEVLDKDGNFYNANYRTAKNILTFVLSGEEDFFKPMYSFQGFRYVRIDEYPEDMEVDLSGFSAIVVHSEMQRTGRFACGDAKINQLYHNVIWGHKSNYLDVPTDCPQRNERLGWTGDTQVFCRTAAINYDVRKFFEKWLGDMRLEQGEDGSVRGVCPENFGGFYRTRIGAGWGDAATIVPWTLYEAYGDESFLSENFEMMRKWVEYMHHAGEEEFLWLGGFHYGDWLAMDAGEDSYVGATSNDLIASAFFAYSTDLLVRAGEVLGKDMSEYKTLYRNVRNAFRSYFMENGMPKKEFPLTEQIQPGKKPSDSVREGMTQTAITLILHFNLCEEEERPALVSKLCELIDAWGGKMTTGFLGTPYILHVLSDNGRSDYAYKLFYAEENPSWLYSVNHGATTMWEHWNGIKEDGSFWSTDMNSFNHYAYGAVADWMYGKICGLEIVEPGYRKIRLAPVPSERLGFAKCAVDTVSGRVESHWYYADGRICFEFTVPQGVEAEICLPNGYRETVGGGSYCYSVAI